MQLLDEQLRRRGPLVTPSAASSAFSPRRCRTLAAMDTQKPVIASSAAAAAMASSACCGAADSGSPAVAAASASAAT